MNKERIDLSDLLLHLFPGEIQHLLQNLNGYIARNFDSKMPGVAGSKVMPITVQKFLVFLGIKLMAQTENMQGGNLWKDGGVSEGYCNAPDVATNT